MRITSETKLATRKRILEVALGLFETQGWENTTTRQIAAGADIATGTLFNYFATREAIALEFLSEAVRKAIEEFQRTRRSDAALDEDLFAFAWTGLRYLRPLQQLLTAPLRAALNPLASAPEETEMRRAHLDAVADILAAHGFRRASSNLLHLYWALYTGVVASWLSDESPGQEDTLALLDRALQLFVSVLPKLAAQPNSILPSEKNNESQTG